MAAKPKLPVTVHDSSLLAGTWANAAVVRHSPHEFTIDFVRADFKEDGTARSMMLVQRMNVSPLLITQLIDALQHNWSLYAQKALPKEVLDDPER